MYMYVFNPYCSALWALYKFPVLLLLLLSSTGVGKWMHSLPSHATLGELHGFSWETLTNKLPINLLSTCSICPWLPHISQTTQGISVLKELAAPSPISGSSSLLPLFPPQFSLLDLPWFRKTTCPASARNVASRWKFEALCRLRINQFAHCQSIVQRFWVRCHCTMFPCSKLHIIYLVEDTGHELADHDVKDHVFIHLKTQKTQSTKCVLRGIVLYKNNIKFKWKNNEFLFS